MTAATHVEMTSFRRGCETGRMPLEIPEGSVRADAMLSRAEAYKLGQSKRAATPRDALAVFSATDAPAPGVAEATAGERDVVTHLAQQNLTRDPVLVPLRMERMLANPFAFYRGTAGLMALDLGRGPHSGIMVAACGDAHISNFGFFASPERKLVFDLNDFDEAAVAPWDWDVKRLVTSIVVGGMHAEYSEREIRRAARQSLRAYRSGLTALQKTSPLERYYMHGNVDFARNSLSSEGQNLLHDAVKAAGKRTAERVVRRTTDVGADGILRFVEHPPTMTRLDPSALGEGASRVELFAQYRETVPLDIDTVLAQYAPTDLVRRVVGVGSVGTQCFLQLLQGSDGDALVLQVKEASTSVLERYGGIAQPPRVTDGVAAHGQGFRVVNLQRILQAVSDPFLGHLQRGERDFYVRQFHDMKGSIELEGLAFRPYLDYVRTCGAMLARAHAQSPTAGQIVGYLGTLNAAIDAIIEWSFTYARQSLRDFEAVRAAHPDALLHAPA